VRNQITVVLISGAVEGCKKEVLFPILGEGRRGDASHRSRVGVFGSKILWEMRRGTGAS